jgi:wyosine [tRNA(Phe)-imidazoG37] synthetase (radical SAM superfamily)
MITHQQLSIGYTAKRNKQELKYNTIPNCEASKCDHATVSTTCEPTNT